VKIKGWLNELLDMLKGEKPFEQLRQPDLFRGKLRHYQQRGYSWLAFLRNWRFGACLADDMGLGKTVQALALIQREYEAGERRPVLLVCPTSVVNNWRREAQQFTPELTVMVHHGSDRQKKEAFEKHAAKNERWGLFYYAGILFAEPLVEGLNRAGRNLTREKLVQEMEGINNFKGIGGRIGYKPFDAKDPFSRQGMKEVFLVQCEPDGKGKKLTDWMEIK